MSSRFFYFMKRRTRKNYGKRNALDVEKYMTRKNEPKLKANTTVARI